MKVKAETWSKRDSEAKTPELERRPAKGEQRALSQRNDEVKLQKGNTATEPGHTIGGKRERGEAACLAQVGRGNRNARRGESGNARGREARGLGFWRRDKKFEIVTSEDVSRFGCVRETLETGHPPLPGTAQKPGPPRRHRGKKKRRERGEGKESGERRESRCGLWREVSAFAPRERKSRSSRRKGRNAASYSRGARLETVLRMLFFRGGAHASRERQSVERRQRLPLRLWQVGNARVF